MIVLNPRRVAAVMLGTAAALVAASSAGQLILYSSGHDHVFGFVPRFSLLQEANVPTWYASTTLLFCAVLLGVVARMERDAGSPYALHWKLLALVFLYLSLDEAAELHELLVLPLRATLNAGGLFYYAWVVPGIAVLAVLAVAYARFLLHLPAPTRRLFLVAAATFVGGALGAEMVGGAWVESRGAGHPVSVLIGSVEEALEMVGIAVFAYALLLHLELRGGAVTIRVRSGGGGAGAGDQAAGGGGRRARDARRRHEGETWPGTSRTRGLVGSQTALRSD
ncbi:MAG TPA: hypothetical protein VFQ76_21885 [Longimicrobiaceae bacterium]|nr:hypothetical protein [Longimicrobiaceae bacterium]